MNINELHKKINQRITNKYNHRLSKARFIGILAGMQARGEVENNNGECHWKGDKDEKVS